MAVFFSKITHAANMKIDRRGVVIILGTTLTIGFFLTADAQELNSIKMKGQMLDQLLPSKNICQKPRCQSERYASFFACGDAFGTA
jgi:hypothetical protein